MAAADDHLLAELRQLDSGWLLPAGNRLSRSELEAALCTRIGWLLQHDFHRLIFLLYRVDISEKKIREVLTTSQGEDSAPLFTKLLLERLAEKARTRQDFARRRGNNETDDEEKW
jgi:hypothetical protein